MYKLADSKQSVFTKKKQTKKPLRNIQTKTVVLIMDVKRHFGVFGFVTIKTIKESS